MSFAELRDRNALSVADLADLFGVTEKTVYRLEQGVVTPKKVYLELLRSRLQQKMALATAPANDPDFTFIDLFAGIGGLRRGFESIGGKCIFTSEWDKFAQRTYRANFPLDEHVINGDITAVDARDIPAHDVLLAGFPCQPFSIAGVSKKNALGRAHGFADQAQGTLFFDVLRILEHHRPAAFLLENVKNLQSHDGGKTFDVITGALKELGYAISWKVIDGKGYVPQHRERIFIAGFRDNTAFDLAKIAFKDPKKGPRLDSILHNDSDLPEDEYCLAPEHKGANHLSEVNPKYTLTDKLWHYLQAYAAKHKARGNGFGFGLNTGADVARTLSARYYKDGSEILIAQEGKNPRRLTPRECARLMG